MAEVFILFFKVLKFPIIIHDFARILPDDDDDEDDDFAVALAEALRVLLMA